MNTPVAVNPDDLLALLGQPLTAAPVQAALSRFARRMQPELDPDEPEQWADWVTVNEIGLEFGFVDEAYAQAKDAELRGQGTMLLTQLYFYGDTPKTQPYPYPLPWGLSFADDRQAVRRKLAAFEASRRTYLRDAWTLPEFELTVEYTADSGQVRSVFCHVPNAPWPPVEGEAERAAQFTPEVFVSLFGQKWSSAVLRQRLAPFDFDKALPEVRAEHTADLRVDHGIEFGFAPGRQVASSDPKFPAALALVSVTYYGRRVLDARQWPGPLPHGLAFADSQAQLATKMGRVPDERGDEDQTGYVVWHFDTHSLIAEYSNIENHMMRIMVTAPGYWQAAHRAGLSDEEAG